MIYANPTPEDLEIVARCMTTWRGSRTVQSMLDGDHVDARAMAAIEVRAERNRRIYAENPGTPAERVGLYGDTALREAIEAETGEELL